MTQPHEHADRFDPEPVGGIDLDVDPDDWDGRPAGLLPEGAEGMPGLDIADPEFEPVRAPAVQRPTAGRAPTKTGKPDDNPQAIRAAIGTGALTVGITAFALLHAFGPVALLAAAGIGATGLASMTRPGRKALKAAVRPGGGTGRSAGRGSGGGAGRLFGGGRSGGRAGAGGRSGSGLRMPRIGGTGRTGTGGSGTGRAGTGRRTAAGAGAGKTAGAGRRIPRLGLGRVAGRSAAGRAAQASRQAAQKQAQRAARQATRQATRAGRQQTGGRGWNSSSPGRPIGAAGRHRMTWPFRTVSRGARAANQWRRERNARDRSSWEKLNLPRNRRQSRRWARWNRRQDRLQQRQLRWAERAARRQLRRQRRDARYARRRARNMLWLRMRYLRQLARARRWSRPIGRKLRRLTTRSVQRLWNRKIMRRARKLRKLISKGALWSVFTVACTWLIGGINPFDLIGAARWVWFKVFRAPRVEKKKEEPAKPKPAPVPDPQFPNPFNVDPRHRRYDADSYDTDQDGDGATPGPRAQPVPRPGPSGRGGTDTTRSSGMHHIIQQISDAFEVLAAYKIDPDLEGPEFIQEVQSLLTGIPEMLETGGNALKMFAGHLGDTPVTAEVCDVLEDLGNTIIAAASDDAFQTWQARDASDIERASGESARPNEAQYNAPR